MNLFVGDEINAVFALEDDPRIATLTRVIEREFGVSLSIGLVGDSVNIASRLEGKTRSWACRT